MRWRALLLSGLLAASLGLATAPSASADPPPWAGRWRHDKHYDGGNWYHGRDHRQWRDRGDWRWRDRDWSRRDDWRREHERWHRNHEWRYGGYDGRRDWRYGDRHWRYGDRDWRRGDHHWRYDRTRYDGLVAGSRWWDR
jgi:hypothetical protein